MKKQIAALAIALVIIALVVTVGQVFQIDVIEERYDIAPETYAVGDAVRVSGIELKTSLLGIDETKVKNTVNASFKDRSVALVTVERVFPNKVIFHLKTRIPVAYTTFSNGTNALADADFQLNRTVSAEETAGYIALTGIAAEGGFNTPQFAAIRRLFYAFSTQKSVPLYALNEIIESIHYTPETLTYTVLQKDGKAYTFTHEEATNGEAVFAG